jgi:hypothetical protein
VPKRVGLSGARWLTSQRAPCDGGLDSLIRSHRWHLFCCPAGRVLVRASLVLGSRRSAVSSTWILIPSGPPGGRFLPLTILAGLLGRATRRALGPDVIVEWGFKVALLGCVRLLRSAGFEAWWFDGDPDAAQQSYVRRRGDSPAAMAAYEVQIADIGTAWPAIERFYGDRVIRTVTTGPAYTPFEEIAATMLE